MTPSTAVDASENDDCISDLPSSIHSDSNEHNAFYVHTIMEDVEQEVNEPISASETTLFRLCVIEENEPQRHAQCCLAKPSSCS